MVKIKKINHVDILSSTFKVIWDKTSNGAAFSLAKSEIIIGIKSYSNDPLYTWSIINHEVMEVILCMMGARFESSRTAENYLFNFDHQTFENAIQVHAQTISKFIEWQK